MADRHVEPGKDGWRVIKKGGTRASATASTRDEAIERARQIIANDGGGELVIHAEGGTVVNRETVDSAARGSGRGVDGTPSSDDTRTAGEQAGDPEQQPRRVQDEVEEKILGAGRTAASTAKHWADQGWDATKGVIGKVRGRIGR